MSAYRTTRRVEFQHCDPAGIVFYPRYFEMVNSVVEEWFDRAVGLGFAEMHLERGIGVPTAHIETTFLRPSRLGDVLDFSLAPARLGRASLDIAVEARCAGESRLSSRSTLVLVEMKTGRPIRWPAELRPRLAASPPPHDHPTEKTMSAQEEASTEAHRMLHPSHWKAARGYANGILATGKTIFFGGQVGWNAEQVFESDDFVDQARQSLENVVAILAEAGGKPEHLVRLTWYVTDKQEYLDRLRDLGAAYKDVIGRHYPAMTLVQVTALVEDRAKVEVEATAVLPE